MVGGGGMQATFFEPLYHRKAAGSCQCLHVTTLISLNSYTGMYSFASIRSLPVALSSF